MEPLFINSRLKPWQWFDCVRRLNRSWRNKTLISDRCSFSSPEPRSEMKICSSLKRGVQTVKTLRRRGGGTEPWDGVLLVNGLHAALMELRCGNKNRWLPVDLQVARSSISPPLLRIENITLYFTRGLREQNVYYLTRNRQSMYSERAGTRTRGSQTLWIRSGDVETELATDSESIFTTTSKNFSAPGPPDD